MRKLLLTALLFSALPLAAHAQDADDVAEAQPDGAAPDQAPAMPEAAPVPPEDGAVAQAPQAAAPAAPGGQWVYTNQYGWVWMPYGQQYTYIPSDTQAYPYMYVYYPVYGWRWVVAPWVYGWGPRPYWGSYGPRYFVWYSHPWFRVGGYWGWGGYRGWGHYRGWVGPRSWGSHGWSHAPAYYRNPSSGWHASRPAYGGHTAAPVYGGHSTAPAYRGHGAAPVYGGHSAAPVGGGFHGAVAPHAAQPAYNARPQKVERHEAGHHAGGRRH